MVLDQPFFLHFGKLPGQSAAVSAEVFCPFHSSKRDLKPLLPLALGLDRQVGQNLLPESLLGDYLHLPHQLPIFPGDDTHHIFNEGLMEHAGVGTGVHHPAERQEQYLAVP